MELPTQVEFPMTLKFLFKAADIFEATTKKSSRESIAIRRKGGLEYS